MGKLFKGITIPINAKDKTQKVFATVQRSIKGFGSAVKSSMKVAAVAIAAVSAAFATLAKKSYDSMDAIQKTSDRIGMNAELLQALQFGAVESGTEIEKLRLGMEKFTKQLGDAAMGTGTAKLILEKYGIQIKDSRNELKSTEDVLFEVVEALGKTESSFEKNATLFALFGRTGAQLNALLGQGLPVLNEVIERYNRLGLAISETTLNAVAKANDKWQEFISLGRSLRDQFFGALAPGFTSMIQNLEDMAIEVAKSKDGFEAWGKALAVDFLEGVKVAAQGAAIMAAAVINLTAGLFEALKAVLELRISISGLWDTFQKFIMSATGVGRVFVQTSEGAATLAKNTEDLKKQLLELGNHELVNFDDLYNELDRIIKLIQNPLGDTDTDEAPKEFVSTWQKVFGQIARSVDNVTNAMTASFTAFFNATSDKFLDFKNLAKDIMKMIITDLVKAWAIMKIINPLRGFFGLDPVGARAAGGTVTAGRPYLVGEKGAELFVPNQTGTIVPNDKMSGGATNVNVAFNITAWDSKDATQAIAQQAPNIVSIVENSFRRRGQILGAT